MDIFVVNMVAGYKFLLDHLMEMISSEDAAVIVNVFNIILNLSLHSNLFQARDPGEGTPTTNLALLS